MEMDGAIEYYYEDNEQLEDDEQAIINFDTEMQHNEHEEQTSAVENNLHGTIETFSNMTEDEIKGSLLGYSAETAEELYDLYTKHSTLVGFSVRKGTVRRVPKTGIVKEKYYLCSFEGKRRETKPKTPKPNVENSKKKKPKQQAITRVDIALPQSTLPMVGMLKHAAKVYTLTLFRDFEKEFKYAMGCISRIEQIQGDFIGYRVKHEEWPEHTGHKVAYDPGSQIVLCTCKNFEESGQATDF
ncbi:Protein FAR1-RELATED SEQUENCE 7 [Bienertia sinuspersici]